MCSSKGRAGSFIGQECGDLPGAGCRLDEAEPAELPADRGSLPAISTERLGLVADLDPCGGGGVGGLPTFVGEQNAVDGGVPAVGGKGRPPGITALRNVQAVGEQGWGEPWRRSADGVQR